MSDKKTFRGKGDREDASSNTSTALSEGGKKPFVEPKLTFIEPKLTKREKVTEITASFVAFTP